MYHHDFVICIEATSHMKPVSASLNTLLKSYMRCYLSRVEDQEYPLAHLRVKFILFRDASDCAEPVSETDFFDIEPPYYENLQGIDDYINGIKYEGGNGYCNALEAIALALKARWTTADRRRQIVLVFSNGNVRPLGGLCRLPSGETLDAPGSLEQLRSLWDGKDGSGRQSTYHANSGRMVIFAPREQPWIEMQSWSRCWHLPLSAGAGLAELDIESTMNLFVYDDL